MSRLVLALVLAASACYAEVGAGYYPSVAQTVTAPTGATTDHDGAGWSASFRLGFYLDVPIAVARTSIGVGLAPVGSDAAIAPDDAVDVTPSGSALRGDLYLGFVPVRAIAALGTRLTVTRTDLGEGRLRNPGQDDYEDFTGGAGAAWFVGTSVGVSRLGTGLLASVGYQSFAHDLPADPARMLAGVRTEARGVGVRVLLCWTPTGAFMKHYTPSDPEPPSPSNAGCYYRDVCDVDGRCRSEYYCP